MFVSILLNYVNHLAAQTHYRFSGTVFANPPKASSLSSRVGVQEERGHCVPTAYDNAPDFRLPDIVFSHIIDCWIARHRFEGHRDRYLTVMESRGVPRQYAQLNMSEWNPPDSTPLWAKKRFKINRVAKVCILFKM